MNIQFNDPNQMNSKLFNQTPMAQQAPQQPAMNPGMYGIGAQSATGPYRSLDDARVRIGQQPKQQPQAPVAQPMPQAPVYHAPQPQAQPAPLPVSQNQTVQMAPSTPAPENIPPATRPAPVGAEKVQAVAEAMPEAEKQLAPMGSLKEGQETKAAKLTLDPKKLEKEFATTENSQDPKIMEKAMDIVAHAATSMKPADMPGNVKAEIAEIDNKYKQGDTATGDSIYKCPLSHEPCGKKSFFRRLKEFFLHSIGKKSSEELEAEMVTIRKDDPVHQEMVQTGEIPRIEIPHNSGFTKYTDVANTPSSPQVQAVSQPPAPTAKPVMP